MKGQDYLWGLLIVAVVAFAGIFFKTWITEFAKWTFEKVFKKAPSPSPTPQQKTVSAQDGSSAVSESAGVVSAPQRQEVGEGGKAIQAGSGAYVSDQSGALEQVRDVYNVAPGGNLTIINNPPLPIEEYTKSLDALKIQLETEKKESLQLLYERGLEAVDRGDFSEALGFLQRATSKGDTPVLRLALSRIYFNLNQFDRAITEADKVLEMKDYFSPQESLQIRAEALNLKGISLERTNCFDEARPFLEESLLLGQKTGAYRDASYIMNLAGILNNLGVLAMHQMRPKEAKKYLKQAIDLHQNIAEKNPRINQNLAGILNNLGLLLAGLGDTDEALKCLDDSINIKKKLAKQKQDFQLADLALTLNNLGNLYKNIGRLKEAEAKHREALSIYKALFKKDPQKYSGAYAGSLHNLGNLVSRTTRFAEAKIVFEKALSIRRKLACEQGEVYETDLAATLDSLGTLSARLSRYIEAENYFMDALEIRIKKATKFPLVGSADLAGTLNNLGNLNKILGHAEEARSYYKRANDIYLKLADQNPALYERYLSMSLNNLGIMELDIGNLTLAEEYTKKALLLFERFAEKWPLAYLLDLARMASNLSLIYTKMNRPDEAAKYRQMAEEAKAEYEKLRAEDSSRPPSPPRPAP